MSTGTAPARGVVLKGIERYRVMDPWMEGLRVVLAQRGERYSPAYIQGLSGGAFRIGGICPCAPTCACAMEPQDLARLLGYEVTSLPLAGEGVNAAATLERVKAEVRARRAALLWHAFTMYEWDVIAGYDDDAGVFYGRGSYAGLDTYAQAAQERATEARPTLGALLIGERVAAPDLPRAEVAALQEAVRHSHSRENTERVCEGGWVMLYGLACYDRWVSDFRADPPHLPNHGDRYCLQVYRSTHAAAGAFLRGVAPHYPAAAGHLLRAAEQFDGEAAALNLAAETLCPDGRLPAEADARTLGRVADLLQAARDRYAGGIDAIAAAVAAIE